MHPHPTYRRHFILVIFKVTTIQQHQIVTYWHVADLSLTQHSSSSSSGMARRLQQHGSWLFNNKEKAMGHTAETRAVQNLQITLLNDQIIHKKYKTVC